MTRQVTLPVGAVHLTAKVRYDIELDWDYAYLTVNGNPVVTNLSTNTNPNNQNFGNGITGSSNGAWVDLSADLSTYAGQAITLGFRYRTDASVVLDGFAVDEIVITGTATDGAETEPGWAYSGFVRTNGVISKSFFNAYYAEFRNYRGYDDTLRTGPVMYPFYPENPRWVEHFPYQDGLLVWYYDTSFANNNVADHCAAGRCGGMVLPVDAHPNLMIHPSGVVWVARLQSYDSTFGLESTDPLCLHWYAAEQCYGSLPANPLFDDTQRYWFPPDPAINHRGYASVEVPHTGTTIRVVSVSAQGDFMQVKVAPKR